MRSADADAHGYAHHIQRLMVTGLFALMLYPELFKQLEAVRWNMDTDIPWDRFDASQLSDEQAQTIKMNAITEWAALPATEMFLRDNRDDSDFGLHERVVLRGAEALAWC
jgi:hypothetical protein